MDGTDYLFILILSLIFLLVIEFVYFNTSKSLNNIEYAISYSEYVLQDSLLQEEK